MWTLNPRAQHCAYPADLAAWLNPEQAQQSHQWLAQWPMINPGPTPLLAMPDTAQRLGLGAIYLKDESLRSPLGSFKALGAPVALLRYLWRWQSHAQPHSQADDPAPWPADELWAGRYADRLQSLTVISATDGNHGRALAAAARDVGCRCVIVLHAQVSAEREAAIAHYGAEIVRIAGDYDDSVREAARLAQREGWQVISDTSYPGYEDIPRDVMQGYSIIAAECQAQQPQGFSHVILQGGVGGLAAGVVSQFWACQGAQRPSFIVVEPAQADCLYQSALQGQAARATGTVDSVMAGLACGETSPLAWHFLQPAVDAFMTIDDAQAEQAMRQLAQGSMRDTPLVAGESGVAGLAGLQALCLQQPALAARLGLDASARVLLINTEGATAPAVYAQIVGEPAQAVQARQRAWQAAGAST